MRYSIILTILFIGAHGAFGQNAVIDSLRSELESHPRNDTVKANILNELSFWVFRNAPKQSVKFAEEARTLSEQLSFPKGIAVAKNNLAAYESLIGNYDDAIKLVHEAIQIGEENKLRKIQAHSYLILAPIYIFLRDYEKSNSFLLKADSLNQGMHDPILTNRILLSRGVLAVKEEAFDRGMAFYNQASKNMSQSPDVYNLPILLFNISIIYSVKNDNPPTWEYLNKALKASLENGDRQIQAAVLNTMGYEKLSANEFDKAEKYLKESLALTTSLGKTKTRLENYIALMQVKNETGKFKDAHDYMRQYYQLKDSILNVEKAREIAKLEIRYETKKKEHAIELLERDKKIQTLWKEILIGLCILITALSLIGYYLLREREKRNRKVLNLEIDRLTTEHKELAEKYKGVLSSPENSIESQDQRILRNAIQVVETNIGDPLFGVEKMAEELNMSRTQIHRKLKSITGFPPSELIRSIRLRKAALLLLNQADSISQISFAVGFEDHSYFTKSFKKQFGVTPSEYASKHVSP